MELSVVSQLSDGREEEHLSDKEGKSYSIVCDQLGTPTEEYDEEGKEVWYRRLDMNGKSLAETQPGLNPEGYVSIPFLFQGQYYDHETGLAYNRFRYYSPELGRYISEDPIRFAGGTLALHNYVEDSNSWLDVLRSTYKNKKEQYINMSELTVGQAQEKLPKKVAQKPRVQGALKKALEY